MRLKDELKFIGYYFLVLSISSAIAGVVVLFIVLPIAAWMKGFHGYLVPALGLVYRWVVFVIYASSVGSIGLWMYSKFK